MVTLPWPMNLSQLAAVAAPTPVLPLSSEWIHRTLVARRSTTPTTGLVAVGVAIELAHLWGSPRPTVVGFGAPASGRCFRYYDDECHQGSASSTGSTSKSSSSSTSSLAEGFFATLHRRWAFPGSLVSDSSGSGGGSREHERAFHAFEAEAKLIEDLAREKLIDRLVDGASVRLRLERVQQGPSVPRAAKVVLVGAKPRVAPRYVSSMYIRQAQGGAGPRAIMPRARPPTLLHSWP